MDLYAMPTTTPRAPQVPPRIPHKAGRPHGSGRKYPFEKLERTGQSFFVPNALLPRGGAGAVSEAALSWAKRRGLRYHPFSVRTFHCGVRVTRVAVGDERGHRTRRYPWGRLAVGESFMVTPEFMPKKGLAGIEDALWQWRRGRPERAGIRYSGKTQSGGVLMTRTA